MQKFIGTSRVARILDVSEARVRQLADSGTLPVAARAEGQARLFDREAIERLAEQRLERRAQGQRG